MDRRVKPGDDEWENGRSVKQPPSFSRGVLPPSCASPLFIAPRMRGVRAPNGASVSGCSRRRRFLTGAERRPAPAIFRPPGPYFRRSAVRATPDPSARTFSPARAITVQPSKAAGRSAHGRLPEAPRTDGSVDHRCGRRPLPHGWTGSSPWPSREEPVEYSPSAWNVKPRCGSWPSSLLVR
jgi:hypothetical protein